MSSFLSSLLKPLRQPDGLTCSSLAGTKINGVSSSLEATTINKCNRASLRCSRTRRNCQPIGGLPPTKISMKVTLRRITITVQSMVIMQAKALSLTARETHMPHQSTRTAMPAPSTAQMPHVVPLATADLVRLKQHLKNKHLSMLSLHPSKARMEMRL